MTFPVIMDVFVVMILAAFAIYGAKRGLLQTLSGLLIMAVSLVGAAMLAATFSPPMTDLVCPIVEERVMERIQEAVPPPPSAADSAIEGSVDELLGLLGLDETRQAALAERARAYLLETGATAVAAVTKSLVYSFVHGLLLALFSVGLTVLLKVLAGAMGLVLKLPLLHQLNALGGGVLGLMEGALLVCLAVWVASRMGVPMETGRETYLLRIFTANLL